MMHKSQILGDFAYFQGRVKVDSRVTEVTGRTKCEDACNAFVALLKTSDFGGESIELIGCFHLAMQLRHHLQYLHVRTFSTFTSTLTQLCTDICRGEILNTRESYYIHTVLLWLNLDRWDSQRLRVWS